jgi:hypothetical protein
MQRQYLDRVIRRAVSQMDSIEADSKWIVSDLRNMRVNFRSPGIDTEFMVENRDKMMRQVWKLGKVHELIQAGLLGGDGSLTAEAYEYMRRQREGKIPSGIIPGQFYVELSMFSRKKDKGD